MGKTLEISTCVLGIAYILDSSVNCSLDPLANAPHLTIYLAKLASTTVSNLCMTALLNNKVLFEPFIPKTTTAHKMKKKNGMLNDFVEVETT